MVEMDPTYAALIAGATLVAKEAASEAVKNAYHGLKGIIRRKLGGGAQADVVLDNLDSKPDVWSEPLRDLLQASGLNDDPDVVKAAKQLTELVGTSQIALGDQNVQVAGDVGTIIQGNVVVTPAGQLRPSFQIVGGSFTNDDRVFAPARNITQYTGDTIADIEWRWAGQGFDMPWQQASGYQLEKRALKWEFDRTGSPEEAQWGDEIQLEIRFHWQGRWRLERHRIPLTRKHHPGKRVHMEMGGEILPPERLDE